MLKILSQIGPIGIWMGSCKIGVLWVYFQIPWRYIPTKTKLAYPLGSINNTYYLHLPLRSVHRYTREIPEPAPFWSRHGARIGGIWVFSCGKITMVRQVHMFCVCFFACVVGKNPNTPNLSLMADDTIAQGCIPGLESPLYICGSMPVAKIFPNWELVCSCTDWTVNIQCS